MKYLKIQIDTEPEVTGTQNGIYSVEIKQKYSFSISKDKEIWNEYCSQNSNNRDRVLFDGYTPFKSQQLSSPIKYFSVGKRV